MNNKHKLNINNNNKFQCPKNIIKWDNLHDRQTGDDSLDVYENYLLVGFGSPVANYCIMAVLRASNFKKVGQTAISICSELPHPTSYLSRIVCRGQEGRKGSTDALRYDFQAKILDVCFF
jgi:hypothetical protein